MSRIRIRIRVKTVAIAASRQVCLLSSVVLLAAGVCFGKLAVSVSPTSGPPTSKLLVSGSGFKANAEIDIYFDTKDEAKVIANSSGSFSKIPIEAPASALPGKHFVSAVQRSGDTGAQAPFSVNTNWSQFGFTSDGQRSNPYENVLNPSTVGGLGLLWSYTTAGAVDASPAVAAGVVYAGSTDGNLYALNAKTGAKVWSYPAGGAVYASAAVANGVVYVGMNNGTSENLYALNASTGGLRWSNSDFGGFASPAVADEAVYFANGGGMEAVNASTGALLWTYTPGFQINASPAEANGVLYTGSLVNAVFYAIDTSTGVPLWTFESGPDRDYAFNSSPAVANGLVYAASDDGNLYALNASTGALVWGYPSGAGSTPAVANGVVYVDGVYALNATTGALLWTSPFGSFPAVADGVVYSVGGNDVYALNASTGALLWSYATGGTVSARPAIANGVVYIGSDDGNVYAFGLTGAAGTKVSAKQEAASNPPDLRTLRADFNLQVSESVARGDDTD
jgi:outer membrane protein assembly factor BamB